MDIHEAVRSLRTRLNLSQQAFATKLGLSIRAIANYEKDRTPSVASLERLQKLAQSEGVSDMAGFFSTEMYAAVGGEKVYQQLWKVYEKLRDASDYCDDAERHVEDGDPKEASLSLDDARDQIEASLDLLADIHGGIARLRRRE